MRIARLIVLVVLVNTPIGFARGEEEAGARPLDWRARASEVGLSDAVVEQIARDGFAVTDETFEQVFTPYMGQELPLFITSDSLLNGYHVLFARTMARAEVGRAAELPDVLRELWRAIDVERDVTAVSGEVLAEARRRLQIVIGTALRLGGEPLPDGLPADVASVIEAEVARVEAATGTDRPDWLGPGDFPRFDYSAFLPRGLYARDEPLQRYFRATRFLQLVPFDVEDDVALTAATLLALHLARGEGESKSVGACRRYLDELDGALPRSDGLTLYEVTWAVDRDESPLRADAYTAWRAELRERAGGAVLTDHVDVVAARPSLRILPAARLPDAVLLSSRGPRDAPAPGRLGVIVGAALGSPVALELLSDAEALRVTKTRETWTWWDDPEWRWSPDLYRQHLHCLSALVADPEPDAPAFFGSEPWRTKSLQSALAGWAQSRRNWLLQGSVPAVVACMSEEPAGLVEPVPAFYARMRTLCARTREVFLAADEALDRHWADMERACLVLELLAHKQLRDAMFSEDDDRWIRKWPLRLAGWMDQNEHDPWDNAPRIVDVLSRPLSGTHDHVGIGRPQALYVRYPFRGHDVLCRGPVLPYVEFSAEARLTDDAWRERLGAGPVQDAHRPKWLPR